MQLIPLKNDMVKIVSHLDKALAGQAVDMRSTREAMHAARARADVTRTVLNSTARVDTVWRHCNNCSSIVALSVDNPSAETVCVECGYGYQSTSNPNISAVITTLNACRTAIEGSKEAISAAEYVLAA